jgi:hypothetical protein
MDKNTAATALFQSREEIKAAEGRQEIAVLEAREAGLSWSEIGSCLLMTKQAAQQRFGRLIETEPSRRTAVSRKADDYIITGLLERNKLRESADAMFKTSKTSMETAAVTDIVFHEPTHQLVKDLFSESTDR